MGLPSYITIRYAIKAHKSDDKSVSERYQRMTEILGHKLSVVEWKGISWRNAYSINEWFLRQAPYVESFPVNPNRLRDLLSICRQIVENQTGRDQLRKSYIDDEESYLNQIRFTLERLPAVIENLNDYCEITFSISY